MAGSSRISNAELSTSSPRPKEAVKPDWSAAQYLKFGNERTRPVYDLVTQITSLITNKNPRIYDLGCGPGNSTAVLADAFPGARITGMDSSPDMLRKAKASFEDRGEDAQFVQGDLEAFEVEEGEGSVDLLFSNAVLHWLRSSSRIPTVKRLLGSLKSGGVFALQVPDNYFERTHKSMRDVASLQDKPWSSSFSAAGVGDLSNPHRPDLDPIETPEIWYKELIEQCEKVDIWRTEYVHPLKDHRGIVEWVKSTGLKPFLDTIQDGSAQEAFLTEYERVLAEKYESVDVGGGQRRVLLGYPRLFVVAVKK